MAAPNAEFYCGSRRLQSELVRLARLPVTAEQAARLAAELARQQFVLPEVPATDSDPFLRFFNLVSATHHNLLDKERFFMPESVELLAGESEPGVALAAVPRSFYHGGLSQSLFADLWKTCGAFALKGQPLEPWLSRKRLQLRDMTRPGSNPALFARAAYEMGLPLLEWPTGFLQIGHGSKAIVLNGSITTDTPWLGVLVARDKAQCNALLARAGFPVAPGGLVANEAAALKQAHALGYPVVVKPGDLDGGKAVACDIQSDEELSRAYRQARAASRNVIVERHMPGRDYRLLLHHDELLVAIERMPGGVIGNGTDDIRTLLDTLNSEDGRGPGPDTPLYTVEFDDEAKVMLGRQGMTLASVPAAGAFVRLRRAANFSLGGNVAPVAEIHPDNLDLALRAKRLLRLDLAGLDLLLPDITRSWRETGGAICEINAQPFIGEPIRRNYQQAILERMLDGDGRIPFVLVVGRIEPEMLAGLAQTLPDLAVVDEAGARQGGHPLSTAGARWIQACQAAMFDRRTTAILAVLDPAQPLPVRSPTDRFTAAIVLDLPAGDERVPRPLAELLRRAGDAVQAAPDLLAALETAGIAAVKLPASKLAAKLGAALQRGNA